MTYFLLTAFGRDRSGIVADLTKILYERGGNLLDASMSRIGGEFSIMLLVRFENAPKDWPTISGLEYHLKEVDSSLARSAQTPSPATHQINVYGHDRPGIVYRVTRLLAEAGGSITHLETETTGTPDKPLYVLLLEIALPASANASQLEQALHQLGRDLQVDVSWREIDSLAL